MKGFIGFMGETQFIGSSDDTTVPQAPPADFVLLAGSGNGGDTGYYRTIYGSLNSEPLPSYPVLEFASRNAGYFQLAFTGNCLAIVQGWQPSIPGVTLGAVIMAWAFDGIYTSATWEDTGTMVDGQQYSVTWEALAAQPAPQTPETPPVPSWDGTPTSNLMSELGHSFIANGQYTTDGYRSYGVATGAADDSGQVVRRLGAAGAFGVGGDTTLQIGARANAAIAAAQNGVVYVWNGINDDALTVEQTLAEMKVWKQKAFDAKTVIVFHTITPCGNDAFPANRKTAAVIADMKSRNARMLAELPGAGCYVVDLFAQVLKPGTDFDLLEKWSPQDGKHPGNAFVQEVSGPADGALLKQIYPNGMRDKPSATRSRSINTNVELLGASATAGATLPTGYTSAKATGTAGTTLTYQEVTTSTGRWCEVVLGGTAATANAAVDILRQIGLQAKIVNGVTYEGVIEYEYDAGMQNILAVQLGMQEAGSTTLLNWDNNRYSTQLVSSTARKGWLRTPPFTAIAGLTDHRFRLSAYLSTAGAPAGKMRFRFMENRDILA